MRKPIRAEPNHTFNSPRVLLQPSVKVSGLKNSIPFQFSSSLIATLCSIQSRASLLPLSILLESYCNKIIITTLHLDRVTFNSPRVLLQRPTYNRYIYCDVPFNSPRVLLQPWQWLLHTSHQELSILLESYCNVHIFAVNASLDWAFNSPRVLLQQAGFSLL